MLYSFSPILMISLPWIHLFLLLLSEAAIRILPGAVSPLPLNLTLIYTKTLHCTHTARHTLLAHHCAHCLHTACTMPAHCLHTACTLLAHCCAHCLPWVSQCLTAERCLRPKSQVRNVGWEARARFTLIKLRPVCELRPASLFSFAAQIRPGVCQVSPPKSPFQNFGRTTLLLHASSSVQV